MAYDLEEQEQLESLKAFWRQYGNLITWILVAVLGGYAAWTYWGSYQNKNSAEAFQLYDGLQKAVAAKDTAKTERAAADLREKFGSTSYATMAALQAAKLAYDSGNLAAAKSQLSWVVGSSKNEAYQAMAKIRLAGILLDEKNYDEAQKQLSGDFPEELRAEAADRKGDIFMAQEKIDEARKAYQEALAKMTDKSPLRSLVEIKLDAIGGAVEVASSDKK